MIEYNEKQEMIEVLKKNNKNSVFGSIFYTFIFSLCIVSTIVLREESLISRLVPTIFMGLVMIGHWVLYFYGRKDVKELNLIIKDMENNPDSEYFDKYYTTEEEQEILANKFKPLTKYIIFFTISLLILVGLVASIQLIPLEYLVLKVIAIILAGVTLWLIIKFFRVGKKFYKYVDAITEETHKTEDIK